ncbi:MAG: YraN family protein [Planctomycetes bacterium]|nr:YraN family protein [Planctomycetota bacterium]
MWMRGWFRGLRGFRRRLEGVMSLGDRGERLAARWLSRRGYRILHRNYTLGRDEADLIALDPDGETIVIVEVKTRSHPHASPEWSLGRDKGYRLARLAARLDGVPEFRDRPVRIDAVAIVWPESKEPQVRHYEAAFESPY